jgi:hypothetical protein
MTETSLLCTVDFDSREMSQPQTAVASAFRATLDETLVQYDTLSVTKEDMLNEYTDSLMTTATVRIDLTGLKTELDQTFELWIDQQMNKRVQRPIHGVELTTIR